ncbi:hypothetical protein D5085_10910 [Ectothiorhodospiraceae bacterium BW-2]|nr:hypothetical protein D5085_10910 [Ectothiorhodospiraceae bacterium BW-2]
MKLLFDNNLSPKLLNYLGDIFPDANHVMFENLDDKDDEMVWEYAKAHNYTIVSKDSDFKDIRLLKGFPPKVIWIRTGNCKVKSLEKIIRNNFILISELHNNSKIGMIEIG